MHKETLPVHIKSQKQRQQALLAAVRKANFPRFNADGQWLAGGMVPSIRERMWHCLALFCGEARHVELANRILATSVDDGGDFNAFFGLWLFRLHEERFSKAARDLLLSVIRSHLDHVHDHLYRYTENCAALNAFALLEAARRFGEARFEKRAREWLEVYADDRKRSGFSQEFVSVNYLPVFLTGISLIARHADDSTLRKMAGEIEASIWLELAACWHPNLSFSAGPSGRSYTYDSIAGYCGLRGLVWAVLGETVSPSPMAFGLFDDPASCPVKSRAIAFFQCGGAAWFGAAEYHVSKETARLFHKKTYPFAMQASVRLPPWRENEPADPALDVCALGGWRSGKKAFLPGTIFHPGGRALISAYLAEDYGVGTASRLLYTQSDSCHALWRRRTAVKSLADIRGLFTRYVVNDALEEHFGSSEYSDLLPEQGRGGCLQSGPLAAAWYAGNDVTTRKIAKLRTCMLLPILYNDVDEVWIGDQSCDNLAGVAADEDWVFVRDGPVYLGLHPLALTNHGRKVAMEVKSLGVFRAIAFYNYDRAPRDFLPAELRQTRGGLVFCIGSEREWQSFAGFRASCRQAKIADSLYESQRRIHCRWPACAVTCPRHGRRTADREAHEIELLWEMQTEEMMWSKRNGVLPGASRLEMQHKGIRWSVSRGR